eukprot:4081748-Prymnesium_polylepis.3
MLRPRRKWGGAETNSVFKTELHTVTHSSVGPHLTSGSGRIREALTLVEQDGEAARKRHEQPQHQHGPLGHVREHGDDALEERAERLALACNATKLQPVRKDAERKKLLASERHAIIVAIFKRPLHEGINVSSGKPILDGLRVLQDSACRASVGIAAVSGIRRGSEPVVLIAHVKRGDTEREDRCEVAHRDSTTGHGTSRQPAGCESLQRTCCDLTVVERVVEVSVKPGDEDEVPLRHEVCERPEHNDPVEGYGGLATGDGHVGKREDARKGDAGALVHPEARSWRDVQQPPPRAGRGIVRPGEDGRVDGPRQDDHWQQEGMHEHACRFNVVVGCLLFHEAVASHLHRCPVGGPLQKHGVGLLFLVRGTGPARHGPWASCRSCDDARQNSRGCAAPKEGGAMLHDASHDKRW